LPLSLPLSRFCCCKNKGSKILLVVLRYFSGSIYVLKPFTHILFLI
jgi:hypothetical protein